MEAATIVMAVSAVPQAMSSQPLSKGSVLVSFSLFGSHQEYLGLGTDAQLKSGPVRRGILPHLTNAVEPALGWSCLAASSLGYAR